jgi:hypothetical protein
MLVRPVLAFAEFKHRTGRMFIEPLELIDGQAGPFTVAAFDHL